MEQLNKEIINSDNAIDVYFNAIQALHDLDNNDLDRNTYTDFIVGNAKLIGASDKDRINSEQTIRDAHNFFIELDKRNTQQTKGDFLKSRDDALNNVLSEDFYWALEGIVDPEVSIAVAIAYVVFIDSNSAVYLEFLRDKWEYRGNLHKDIIYGGKWLYFYYSSEAPEGEVSWRYENKPLTYEWEIKKAERERKEKYEELISQSTYDDVESLDIDNKKLLFLVDYPDSSIRLRHKEEYCYVVGSMIYLFNYACSFVGDLKAKPDYIVVDQNSVAVGDMEAVLKYKQDNPDVTMLELNTFVELLEKVDLKKLKKDKPALTSSELKDEYTGGYHFGAPLDKPQDQSLKTYCADTYLTDLELVKATKHITMPEDYDVTGKIFVFANSNHKYEEKVKAKGGIIKKSVSGKTDYFVIDLADYPNKRLCVQVNTLFDKGKGDKLHVITPRILRKLLK